MSTNAKSRPAGAAAAAWTAKRALIATSAAVTALALWSGPAPGQQQQGQQQQGQQGAARQGAADQNGQNMLVLIIPGVEMRLPPEQRARPVSAEALYKGVRASRLMDQNVYGPNGNQIGEVQDILVDADGQVTAIVVEAGGFLDIGDAAFRVKWSDVNLTPGRDGVQIPTTENKAERRGLFDGPETVATGPREFRLSELIGDYTRLRDGAGYGRVSDVALSREGKVLGVVVTRDIGWGGGLYGYPFYGYGYGFDPGNNYYALPFGTADEAARAPRLDYRRFEPGVL